VIESRREKKASAEVDESPGKQFTSVPIDATSGLGRKSRKKKLSRGEKTAAADGGGEKTKKKN